MPTRIERSYLAQGYRLPEGLTWGDVKTLRARRALDPDLVPVATAPGCIAWAIPIVDGRPLARYGQRRPRAGPARAEP